MSIEWRISKAGTLLDVDEREDDGGGQLAKLIVHERCKTGVTILYNAAED